MAPLDVLPPYDYTPTSQEISRAAEEIRSMARKVAKARAKYIGDRVNAKTSLKLKTLHYANASDMSDREFRQLFNYVVYADVDGTNAYPSHDTIAIITGRGVKTSERAARELEKLGWLDCQRQRQKSTIRAVTIPRHILDAISFEILEQTNLSSRTDKYDRLLIVPTNGSADQEQGSYSRRGTGSKKSGVRS